LGINTEIDAIQLIILGTTAMVMLTGFIILFVVMYQKRMLVKQNEIEAISLKHQKDILQKSLEIEEKEREKMAKNVHDDIGALLSLLRINNSRIIKNLDKRENLEKIQINNSEILNETAEHIRALSNQLASPTLQKLGLYKAVNELANQFNKTEEIIITNNLSPELNTLFDLKDHKQIYRVIKEIINNVFKHANAKTIELSNINKDIIISHDGDGISNSDVDILIAKDKGLGLVSLRNRAELIKAKINYTKNIKSNISIEFKK